MSKVFQLQRFKTTLSTVLQFHFNICSLIWSPFIKLLSATETKLKNITGPQRIHPTELFLTHWPTYYYSLYQSVWPANRIFDSLTKSFHSPKWAYLTMTFYRCFINLTFSGSMLTAGDRKGVAVRRSYVADLSCRQRFGISTRSYSPGHSTTWREFTISKNFVRISFENSRSTMGNHY